ncbi:MAG: RNA 2',3'-cyclic phosphodiesterase [Myxococcaceae bacterium]
MRLFVAIELGDEIRARATEEIQRLAKRAPDVKWVRPEAMHLTLAFLGEVEEEKLPALEAAIETVAARHRPVSLAVSGGGTFGGSKHPRVLWSALSGDLDELAQIQADLAAALVPLGYTPELRDFQPHLTFARARNPRGDAALADCAQALQSTRLGEVTVRELVLFQSQLSPKGARYTALLRAALSR